MPNGNSLRTVRAACGQCQNQCGVKVSVRGEQEIVRVEGDRQNPLGGSGDLCVKNAAALDFHTHRNRLNFPLKRVGRRGEDRWQQIPWEQALDEIADKLAEIRSAYGPEAMVVVGGNFRHGDTWAQRFCNLFGTPNLLYQGKNCGEVEIAMDCAALGYPAIGIFQGVIPGITRCVLLWGHNPAESFHLSFKNYRAAKEKGAKIVVIDPRRTRTAEIADLWLQLRPGTDGALALGLIHVIIEENLYDREFVERWCQGFDQVREVAGEYSPRRTSQITWVPEDQIVQAARWYATLRPSHLTWGVAIAQLGRGCEGDSVKAAALGKSILRAICGSLDVEGGSVFLNHPDSLALQENIHWDRQLDHPLKTRDNVGAEKYPFASIRGYRLFREAQAKIYPKGLALAYFLMLVSSDSVWPAILDGQPYPIKAVVTQGSNPLVSLGDSRTIYRALKSDELSLHVAMDLTHTPTTMLADYVLPAADWLERPNFSGQWGFGDTYWAGAQAVRPLGERRDDYALWQELGNRLGQESLWPDRLEGMFDLILKPTGTTFEKMLKEKEPWHIATPQFRRYEGRGFATFSGKVELIPSILERLGYDARPLYGEPGRTPTATPELAQEYPLILISGGRVISYYHSSYREQEKLRQLRPHPLLEIHPQTAHDLGIADGDPVYIETPEGKVRQRARLNEGIDPRVVHADGHWWYPELPGKDPCLFGVWESNINSIAPGDSKMFNYEGDNPLRALLCRVYRAKD